MTDQQKHETVLHARAALAVGGAALITYGVAQVYAPAAFIAAGAFALVAAVRGVLRP